jgi:Ca-activated chloride channel family protein
MRCPMPRFDSLTFYACTCLSLCAMSFLGCGQVESTATSRQPGTESAVSGLTPSEALDLPELMNTEEYDAIDLNPFRVALEEPQSTFSIDVDTASYSNVRRMLRHGQLPPPGAVRIEELVNYFCYDYPEPQSECPFAVETEVASCPWNASHYLLRIGLRGKSVQFDRRPASNLVFLLDVSGSMLHPEKLPLVKSALHLLTEQLDERDRVAIVVYAGASGLVLKPTSGDNSVEIRDALERLQAGGSTNGGDGIRLAYQVALDSFIEGGVNRVILCTDGDFNVGTTNRSELVGLIEANAKSNVFLTVLGFGAGNLKDATMEQLADRGNGNYAYIDTVLEAKKVLVEQISGTLLTIAKDVKIQVDFNPQHVHSYRLLGYENRMLENQDFRDDSKDAGEIGAGHTVTAFYEIVPADQSSTEGNSRESEFVSTSVRTDADPDSMLTVNLRYKLPDASESQEFQLRVASDDILSIPSSDFRFASAVVGYGRLLRGEAQADAGLNWDWVIDAAESCKGDDPHGLRTEFLQLAKLAKGLQ